MWLVERLSGMHSQGPGSCPQHCMGWPTCILTTLQREAEARRSQVQGHGKFGASLGCMRPPPQKEGRKKDRGLGRGKKWKKKKSPQWRAAGRGLTDGIPKLCQRMSSMVLVTVNSSCSKESTKGPAVSCTYVTHSSGHCRRKAITTHCK